jgi:hypothetical protein
MYTWDLRASVALARSTACSPLYTGPGIIKWMVDGLAMGNPAGGYCTPTIGFNQTRVTEGINLADTGLPTGQAIMDSTFNEDAFSAAATPGDWTYLQANQTLSRAINYIIPLSQFAVWFSMKHGNNVNADRWAGEVFIYTSVDTSLLAQLIAG